MKKLYILALLCASMISLSYAANTCSKEGKTANGTVSPQYQTKCCKWLQAIYPYTNTEEPIVGGPSLCVNPKKGTPICKYSGTKKEGWYYKNGKKISLWKCNSPKKTEGEEGSGTASPTICTMDYKPVCANVEVQCIKAPCNPIQQTFGNKCSMNANKHATFLYTGECKN